MRPVFVSAGHLIDLPTAERIILACTPRRRLPEPLRPAHRAAAVSSFPLAAGKGFINLKFQVTFFLIFSPI